MDAETMGRRHFQWARIFVRSNGKRLPSLLHVVVGSSAYTNQLWWESSQMLASVSTKEGCRVLEVRDDCEGRLSLTRRVGVDFGNHEICQAASTGPLCVDHALKGTRSSFCSSALEAEGAGEKLALGPYWMVHVPSLMGHSGLVGSI